MSEEKNENMNENMDDMGLEVEYNVVTLLDEDGTEHEFELVDSAEFEGHEYMALIPIYDSPEELLEDSGELIVLRVAEEDGEQYLDAIEDEEEYNLVSDLFVARLSDVFDFEEDDE